jgi:hypothetical protein
MPHFGSTTLLVAPDSGLDRLSIAFADSAFHLGWAELIAGWLLLLADAQLQTLTRQDVLSVQESSRREIGKAHTDIESRFADARRCRVEPLGERFLFLNFRRTASGQPRRIVL